jgi:ferredoxin-NADP reductase
MDFINSILNKITMYRLVVYGLTILAVSGVLLASFGRLAMSPIAMIESLGVLLAACFVTEWALAKVWRTPFNSESWLITALIIFLIFPAPRKLSDVLVTILVGVLSSASKYLISWQGKHIFNPAAFAVAVSGVVGLQTSTWWVGNSTMWPLVLVIGLLIVRKIRRFPLYVAFTGTAIAAQLTEFVYHHSLNIVAINGALFASPLIFLGTIMLTEPATMPPKRYQQIIFGMIVAVLYVKGEKIGPIPLYPEVALLIGNVLAFVVAPKLKVRLRLKEIQQISDQVYNYVFLPDRTFAFDAGQYMEWTLPQVEFDNRGNRRTFTIASSPTEDTVQVGVKFYNPSSMYKYQMSRMQPGDVIYGSQLAGSFTLVRDSKTKLAFVAGGIGITPFRSMAQYLLDTNQTRDIVLVYIVSRPEELAYADDFMAAEQIGMKVVPVLSNPEIQEPGMISARLSKELIEKTIPDYNDRTFYISGPNAMVHSAKTILRELDVDRLRIKTDHFSGY